MGYYWVLNIYQRLLGPWLGINPIEHYMIAVQPSLITLQFLTDCQCPVMSHKISDTHNEKIRPYFNTPCVPEIFYYIFNLTYGAMAYTSNL